MKNTIKKISAFLLSLVLLLGIVPLADLDIIASAETYSGTCGDNLTWTLDTKTGELVISGSGDMDNYTSYSPANVPWVAYTFYIKSVIIGNGVTSIGDYAFGHAFYSLASVTIGNSVKSIGDYAFSNCVALTSIVLPDSVTSIGEYAFQKCTKLESIELSDGILFIDDYTFYGCTSLISIDIPDGVTYIDYHAFSGCTSLVSIELPSSITRIGSAAFSDCTNLENVYYNGDIIGWCGITFVSSIFKDDNASNLYINGTLVENIVIPESVTSINNYTFYGCDSLISIEIPNSVTKIGFYAFSYCTGLANVTIGDGVTSICNNAFRSCTSLTNITIGGSVIEIGAYAFYKCTGITNIELPNSVTSIGSSVFDSCDNLVDITIGNSVSSIGEKAFYNCTNLKNVYYNGEISGWCDISFASGSSNPLNNESNLYINGTLVKELVIPDSVTSINDYTFYGCTSLVNIQIPNGVTNIGSSTFRSCINLTSIIIPDSVKSIGSNSFYNTAYYNDLANWEKDVLYIGNHLIEAKKTLSGDYCIKDGTKLIARYAFSDCKGVTSVIIPRGITNISHGAFEECTSLESVTFSNSITSIGNFTFDNCSSLADVYYKGTKEQWNTIDIGVNNTFLLNSNIHFLGHECDYTAVVTPPTCQTQGYTTYTCEECGDSYVDDYTDIVDHYYLDGKCIWCGDTNVTPSSIINITYTPSDSARKLFTVTCADRAQMIQFIEPDGGTRTYYRNNANVKITSYNADGEVVGELSRDLAYEVWEIYSNMSIGTTIKVRAKFNSRWELDKRSLVVYEYNPVISMELSRTSGKKGPVPATVVADEKTEKVMFKMPNNTSVTVSTYTTDENGNRVFKGNAWMNEDGLNEINVLIRRKNVWKTVGTLEYTVE